MSNDQGGPPPGWPAPAGAYGPGQTLPGEPPLVDEVPPGAFAPPGGMGPAQPPPLAMMDAAVTGRAIPPTIVEPEASGAADAPSPYAAPPAPAFAPLTALPSPMLAPPAPGYAAPQPPAPAFAPLAAPVNA